MVQSGNEFCSALCKFPPRIFLFLVSFLSFRPATPLCYYCPELPGERNKETEAVLCVIFIITLSQVCRQQWRQQTRGLLGIPRKIGGKTHSQSGREFWKIPSLFPTEKVHTVQGRVKDVPYTVCIPTGRPSFTASLQHYR